METSSVFPGIFEIAQLCYQEVPFWKRNGLIRLETVIHKGYETIVSIQQLIRFCIEEEIDRTESIFLFEGPYKLFVLSGLLLLQDQSLIFHAPFFESSDAGIPGLEPYQ